MVSLLLNSPAIWAGVGTPGPSLTLVDAARHWTAEQASWAPTSLGGAQLADLTGSDYQDSAQGCQGLTNRMANQVKTSPYPCRS